MNKSRFWHAALIAPLLGAGCGGAADNAAGATGATASAESVSADSSLFAADGAAPAAARRAANASAIVSGLARFEVLSPTLIRTEYAPDGKFLDGATFNAVGRDDFAKTPFTSSTANGWLTLATSALTLKYKVGSGAFTASNLVVTLKTGQQAVTAAPWRRAICNAGRLCEADSARLSGVAIATDHAGYTGQGFAAGFEHAGNALTLDVSVPADGAWQLDTRYANALGGDGQVQTRTLTVSVDGAAGQTLTLPATADWNTWSLASVPLALTAGSHTLVIARGAADSGDVNFDSLAVVAVGAAFPDPSQGSVVDCQFGALCEAENGALIGGAAPATDHAGYSGSAFVARLLQGAGLSNHVINVPAAGTYALQVRYANGLSSDGSHQARHLKVSAGGIDQTLSLPVTADWDTWNTATIALTLAAGDNDIVVTCPDTAGCQANLDALALTAANAPAPLLHVALGGYRRSVDNIDGAAPLTAGLLYKDGWYLLDDTASAQFDTASRSLSPRPARPSYQDGYIIGYGQNYKKGLADLATLTGPSKLLPRWAYGVWYSEYYDRSAADYENTILPHFRADGVPLDVLVTDTDFKAPNTWNGWEMDTRKFPDPQAFFDWAQAQGLHSTLNIHASIPADDPQLAQAQATAGNKLGAASCFSGACFTFDWADPGQMTAYLNLHQTLEQQGVDFWWLDWCCDNSTVSRTDVTPDAWINEQYANDANKTVGRGFAFSRAYGSWPSDNQPNLPTGPWADKRTTVHFTADASSTWKMLAAEVNYTPAESAATGLSAISHDIGGFNPADGAAAGAEPGSKKLDDDLYARWVQLGTFQPIDRLHGNHSDRLPWQYGPEARDSAEKFLRLREALVPYTYTLARQANLSGVPVVRATYLEYPAAADAYTAAGNEYFYGPDLLVAPVTAPGSSATTPVWFPPGQWTDYFTGLSYAGGSTQNVSTSLATMPVFIRSGAILALRDDNAANDVQNPLASVALTIAAGASGSFKLYEDDGRTLDTTQSATTPISYAESAGIHTLKIAPAKGSFAGQVSQRSWSVVFLGAQAPAGVTLDGTALPATSWSYDAAGHRLTVHVSTRAVTHKTVVAYH